MKAIDEWDEKYILDLAVGQELDALEFKGRQEVDPTLPNKDIRRENLAKTLSALVNLGGGTLILGINDRTKNIDDGGIDKNIKNGTKEWLENILPPLVDPPLPKLNVYEICGKSEDSKILPGRALYVVEIKESPLAPHQSAHDHVYYGRAGSKSIPLGHRMVLDIINRKQYPNLEVSFVIASFNELDPNRLLPEGQHKILWIIIENSGQVYAKYVNSILFIPKYLVHPVVIQNILNSEVVTLDDGIQYVRIVRENVISEIYSEQMRVVGREAGRYTPILPGRTHSWTVPLVDDFWNYSQYFNNKGPKIRWELYADNAPVKKGEFLLKDIKSYKP